jgi:hypothetical protein
MAAISAAVAAANVIVDRFVLGHDHSSRDS